MGTHTQTGSRRAWPRLCSRSDPISIYRKASLKALHNQPLWYCWRFPLQSLRKSTKHSPVYRWRNMEKFHINATLSCKFKEFVKPLECRWAMSWDGDYFSIKMFLDFMSCWATWWNVFFQFLPYKHDQFCCHLQTVWVSEVWNINKTAAFSEQQQICGWISTKWTI